jgi:peptidoglycan/LPS O-acetylase OafA/YrhL
MRPAKVQYLEGLRGIAAVQVVLLHFVTGFLPHTAQHAWPPLRLLFDGHTAVYLFFVISGAVLTPSFARAGSFIGKLAKRVVRLGIPVAAVAALSTLLIGALPDAHRQAAMLTGSAWLAMDSSGAPTFAHLIREISLDSLLLGYREVTLFVPFAQRLPPMEHSLDAPFWSLHLELYGSLLVLCLVSLRAFSVVGYRLAVAAAALTFATHPMFLFVAGHLLGVGPRSAGGIGRATLGMVTLLAGLWLCTGKDWSIIEWLRIWISRSELAASPNLFQFQSQLGAVALYLGVLLSPVVWPALESAPFRALGRLSFSIYLLHFPILFTLVCRIFTAMLAPSVIVAFVALVALTLVAAILFERFVDRPAIMLSRRIGLKRLQRDQV